jgi:hypothetical protein
MGKLLMCTMRTKSAEAAGDGTAGAIVTAANVEVARSHRLRRQRYNWLVWMPAARATSDAIAPGSSDSTRPFVI